MLKIVDCAIAVCAATTNNRATNNPDRTLEFFTVLDPPFLLSAKKNAQRTHLRVQHWTSSSSDFLPHSSVRQRHFCNRCARDCQQLLSRGAWRARFNPVISSYTP